MNPFTLSPVLRTNFQYITPNSTQGQWTGLWPMNARTAPMPQSVESAYGAEQPSGGSTYAQELSHHGTLEPYATHLGCKYLSQAVDSKGTFPRDHVSTRENENRGSPYLGFSHHGATRGLSSTWKCHTRRYSEGGTESPSQKILRLSMEYDQWSGLYKLSYLSEDTKFHEGYEAP
ncbi:hypothetical protein JB92DRAFT_2834360 [Gautieria morchelliformis]|nr:hypothetical protein JB92DRAFT_2834360 [Gautieria morchelliformis]